MNDPAPESARAFADDEGLWLELKMNSTFCMKIPLGVAEAERLASDLVREVSEWKKRHPNSS